MSKNDYNYSNSVSSAYIANITIALVTCLLVIVSGIWTFITKHERQDKFEFLYVDLCIIWIVAGQVMYFIFYSMDPYRYSCILDQHMHVFVMFFAAQSFCAVMACVLVGLFWYSAVEQTGLYKGQRTKLRIVAVVSIGFICLLYISFIIVGGDGSISNDILSLLFIILGIALLAVAVGYVAVGIRLRVMLAKQDSTGSRKGFLRKVTNGALTGGVALLIAVLLALVLTPTNLTIPYFLTGMLAYIIIPCLMSMGLLSIFHVRFPWESRSGKSASSTRGSSMSVNNSLETVSGKDSKSADGLSDVS